MMGSGFRFVWEEHPIGHPIDPEDTDFRGLRTLPQVSCAIVFYEDLELVRQAISREGTKKTITEIQQAEMQCQLLDWLQARLRKQAWERQ